MQVRPRLTLLRETEKHPSQVSEACGVTTQDRFRRPAVKAKPHPREIGIVVILRNTRHSVVPVERPADLRRREAVSVSKGMLDDLSRS